MNVYLIDCKTCGGTTSRKYARTHEGQCKHCADPQAAEAKRRDPQPQWGSQEWAEARGDDLGLSPDF